jgi:predicted MPP superfamily phosphohydrolase
MPRLTWVHVSDLHANSPQYGWDAEEVLGTVTKDLGSLSKRYDIQPDLFFFTGDAAFGTRAGSPSMDKQFDEAWRILDSVRKVFGDRLPKERCFVVPGNHDVDRDLISPDNQSWLDQLKQPTPLVEVFEAKTGPKNLTRNSTMARFGPYRGFLERSGLNHCGSEDPVLGYSRQIDINGLRIGIAGFNSAVMCSKDEEKGKLWMASRWQVNRVLPKLANCDLKIALVHHPDSWLHQYEDKLFQDLSTQFHFVLHGHEHEQWVDPASPGKGPVRHVRVAAAALYDRSDLPNGYSIVQWDSESDTSIVYLREYVRIGRGWRGREIPNVTDERGRWPKDAQRNPQPPAPPVPSPARVSSERSYLLQEIASGTTIQEDGDCYRVVEFNNIQVRDKVASECFSRVPLSTTTGYIDPDFVRAKVLGGMFPGFRSRFDPRNQTGLSLDFGRPLSSLDRFSLEYSWWALNGFAMDERQFKKQYGKDDMEELSHLAIVHHTDEVVLYVLFPKTFVETSNFDLRSQLSVRVSSVDEYGSIVAGSRKYDREDSLRSNLRFMRQLGLACLRIEKPEPGFSYGITWRVPPFRPPDPGVVPGTNRDVLNSIENRLLEHRATPDPIMEKTLGRFFSGMLGLIQQFVFETSATTTPWKGELELSIMVFDNSDRQLKVVSRVRKNGDWFSAYPFPELYALPYGVGVAGKAYKTNALGFWERTSAEDRTAPDRYVALDKSYAHKVLLSIPLQNPGDSRYVFAIANVGSDDPECPLVGLQRRETAPKLLKDLQKALSEKAFAQIKER